MRTTLFVLLALSLNYSALGQEDITPKTKTVSGRGRFLDINFNGCSCSIQIDYRFILENENDAGPHLEYFDINILTSKPEYCISLMDPWISLQISGYVNGNQVRGWVNGLGAKVIPDEPNFSFNNHRDYDANYTDWRFFLASTASKNRGSNNSSYDVNTVQTLWNAGFVVESIRFWPTRDFNELLELQKQEQDNTQKKADALVDQGKYDEAIAVWEEHKTKYPGDIPKAENEITAIKIKKQDHKRDVNSKQENAAATEQVELMTVLGALMFKDMDKDGTKSSFNKGDGGTRFNFNMGYSFSSMPIYDNADSEYGTYTSSAGVNTLNLDIGLQFWPYYSDFLGLGLISNAKGGYLPIGGQNFSYQYDYGAQLFLGARAVKLTALYQMGDRGFQHIETFASYTGDTYYDSEGAAKFTRMVIGPRFSFGTTHPVGNLDLLYVMESYPNMSSISASGFQIIYSSHNRIKIYGEAILGAARMGVIKYELQDDVKNNGLIIQIGVVRMLDWF